MPAHLTRRTMLTMALATSGLILGARSAVASPLTAVNRGRFVDVTGWPANARALDLTVGPSGTWAIGQQHDRSGLHSSAVLRRRVGASWVPVALPASFKAWGSAAYADATGVWVAGTRGEVTLPVSDGSTVVGHVSTSGTWKGLGAVGLPSFLTVASLKVEGALLLLTGMRPTPDGSSLRPFAATKPLGASPSVHWASLAVDAPVWDSGTAAPLLRLAEGAPSWATAGTWLLRRQAPGWKVVDGPPGTFAQTKSACALAEGQIHVVTQGVAGPTLWRRTTSSRAWRRIALPTNFGAQAMAGDARQLWVVGQTQGGEDFAATALRVVGGSVVDTVGGPLSAGGPVGILEHVAVAADGPLAAGYRATAPGGKAIGWTCRLLV